MPRFKRTKKLREAMEDYLTVLSERIDEVEKHLDELRKEAKTLSQKLAEEE